jgi:ABC-type dipeptide/oligopeptide/nickel transport system permease component
MELLDSAYNALTLEEQVKIYHEIQDIAAENVWNIGIASSSPWIAIVKKDFRNVPRKAIYSGLYSSPSSGGFETYYFENPKDSPGAVAQIKGEMTEIAPSPYSTDRFTVESSSDKILSRLIRLLVTGSLVFGLVLVGVKHPYVGRRFLIMAPTLLIISVIAFTIIQLPPGNFIDTKILQAELTDDQKTIAEAQQLREIFPIDKPIVTQYAHWLGLPWFLSFKPADQGLLQGHMGFSMHNRQPINTVVGDRILLTFLISLGSVLFTWAVALPIGIYSAVRQYSVGDYFFTLLGFIGMCVPSFLLALLLMYWSSVYFGISMSGLFSPDYATQPEWSRGKVVDLMQHIWMPVVVLGVTGTASMIRVMRGNLLDELKKPYVITAMAKGVRPFKLLLKYPLRIALNPFISGIGTLFPQLVSGGAIVAMVLSLPTVGPMMLEALMTEDMYLAGSMLMVLSLLGVFGTLVSDLLLMWLDPRIRFEGGVR